MFWKAWILLGLLDSNRAESGCILFWWSPTWDQNCSGQPQTLGLNMKISSLCEPGTTRKSCKGFIFLICEGRNSSSHWYGLVLAWHRGNIGNHQIYIHDTLGGKADTANSHSLVWSCMWETLTHPNDHSACHSYQGVWKVLQTRCNGVFLNCMKWVAFLCIQIHENWMKYRIGVNRVCFI